MEEKKDKTEEERKIQKGWNKQKRKRQRENERQEEGIKKKEGENRKKQHLPFLVRFTYILKTKDKEKDKRIKRKDKAG